MADLDWKGDQVLTNLDDAILSAVEAAGELLGDEAVQRTPKETGTLQGSMKVTTDGQATAAVSFNTPYAARQHEEIGWNHPGGGEAKYLENAMSAAADRMQAAIAKEIGKVLK